MSGHGTPPSVSLASGDPGSRPPRWVPSRKGLQSCRAPCRALSPVNSDVLTKTPRTRSSCLVCSSARCGPPCPGASQLGAKPRHPLAPRARPTSTFEVDVAAPVEAHALALEEVALDGCAEPVTMAAPARSVDDALPGDGVEERPPQHPERHADRPGTARLAKDRRDLAVGYDLAARHATHEVVDQPVEARRAPRHHRSSDPRRRLLQETVHCGLRRINTRSSRRAISSTTGRASSGSGCPDMISPIPDHGIDQEVEVEIGGP